MKNRFIVYTLIIGAIVCLSPSCKKTQDETSEVSKLPAITQTGANTFGCLVNGVAFIPHSNSLLNSSFQCNYIYTNGGYNLSVGASNDSDSDYDLVISLGTVNMPLTEGKIFKLESNQPGSASGKYTLIYGIKPTILYQTSTTINGQLTITKFDQVAQIVSGTFFYDAINGNGDILHITEGRFDMKYTR